MAEYCLDCFNKLVHHGEPLTINDVLIDYDICENCSRNLPIVKQIIKEIDE